MQVAIGDAAVVAAAALTTWLATAGVIRLAPRVGAVVEPDERRVHLRATPTGGGTAMFLGMLAALALASRLDAFRTVFAGSSEAFAVVVAGACIFGIGALDDLRTISAPAKVAGQVLAGSLLAVFGITLLFARVPFGGLVVLSADWATTITVLLVVIVANAVNLTDGLDGLAAGTVAIASAAMYLYATRLQAEGLIDESSIGPLLALVTFGVCLGFLPYNLHPARVFMGDSGAMLLGLLVAAASVTINGRVVDQFPGQVYFFFAPVVIPILLLGVPLADSALAVIRRIAGRKAITGADKDHLHHRLMRMGHGHRRTVLLLWAWTALLAALALAPIFAGGGEAVLPLGIVGGVVLLRFLFRPTDAAQSSDPVQRA